MAVHKRFVEFLEWRGWSQHKAAEAIGCSQAMVSDLCAEKKRVAKIRIAHTIERLTDAEHAFDDGRVEKWPGGMIRAEEWEEPGTPAAATGTDGA